MSDARNMQAFLTASDAQDVKGVAANQQRANVSVR